MGTARGQSPLQPCSRANLEQISHGQEVPNPFLTYPHPPEGRRKGAGRIGHSRGNLGSFSHGCPALAPCGAGGCAGHWAGPCCLCPAAGARLSLLCSPARGCHPCEATQGVPAPSSSTDGPQFGHCWQPQLSQCLQHPLLTVGWQTQPPEENRDPKMGVTAVPSCQTSWAPSPTGIPQRTCCAHC